MKEKTHKILRVVAWTLWTIAIIAISYGIYQSLTK